MTDANKSDAILDSLTEEIQTIYGEHKAEQQKLRSELAKLSKAVMGGDLSQEKLDRMAEIRTRLAELAQETLDAIHTLPGMQAAATVIVAAAKRVKNDAGTMQDVARSVGALAQIVNALAALGETVESLAAK